MGSRDYRHRETKKAKKDSKKATPSLTSVLTPEQPVEVIKSKGKKEQPLEE